LEEFCALIGDGAAGAALDGEQPAEARGAIAIDKNFIEIELGHSKHRRRDTDHRVKRSSFAAVLSAKRDEIDRAGDRPIHIVMEKLRDEFRIARHARVVEIPHALA
jgi:hypothetical protein